MIAAVRVTRSRRSALWGLIGAVVAVGLLATLPYVVYADVTDLLVNAFILLVLASMWNLLAGYCGLISVGQQAYIGVGAYTVLLLAQNGINPYLAIPFAVVLAGAIAVPVSFLVFRLRAEYFAIGTWVVAEVFFLVLIRFRSLGGGTGTSLPGLALIGGVGSIEGPIVGTAIFTVIQQTLAQSGAWYLILLGSLAVAVAMFLPTGIWGLISSRFHIQVFPVGYWLHR